MTQILLSGVSLDVCSILCICRTHALYQSEPCSCLTPCNQTTNQCYLHCFLLVPIYSIVDYCTEWSVKAKKQMISLFNLRSLRSNKSKTLFLNPKLFFLLSLTWICLCNGLKNSIDGKTVLFTFGFVRNRDREFFNKIKSETVCVLGFKKNIQKFLFSVLLIECCFPNKSQFCSLLN